MTPEISLTDLTARVGGTLRGRGDVVIRGVADVSEAGPDELAFISNPAFTRRLPGSKAGAALVPADFGPTPMPAVLCRRVDRALAAVLAYFAPPEYQPPPGVHATAVVSDAALIGEGCAIGAHVVIGPRSRLGPGCTLFPGVYVGAEVVLGSQCRIGANAVVADRCELGDRVVLHPGAVIGGDGFGFYFDEGRHNRVPHVGRVILEDDVEVGSCSCVDRAKFGATRVGKGTKIDNLVQVAHNVRLGSHCLLAGQTALAGSSRAGDYCVFGGRSATTDGVRVGDGAVIAACSVAARDIPAGQTVLGFPAQDIHEEKRERASLRRLPKFFEKIRQLTARIEQLEAAKNDQSRDHV
ncbi:MAG: UDP-3-O-(3-hydroxymyristoyl)glucosamine N-acyltransferase [Phycisphaerales bacterium]|nr:MAG: UDP-3-O-(3-hydroxymyristoyl)glucosamine N-acyltransferase [Phycisphaerales bacterium]